MVISSCLYHLMYLISGITLVVTGINLWVTFVRYDYGSGLKNFIKQIEKLKLKPISLSLNISSGIMMVLLIYGSLQINGSESYKFNSKISYKTCEKKQNKKLACIIPLSLSKKV